MEVWTALVIGFLGSFHCIGMCGPIALALPGSQDSRFSLVSGRILYNMGRVCTYGVLGIVFGLVGHSVALAGLQKMLSITLGLIVITVVVMKSRRSGSIGNIFGDNVIMDKLKTLISRQFNKRGMSTLFTIGILNGLLPCGFVYVGLAGSLTMGSIWEGAFYMVFFGLGTLPAMLVMSLAPNIIGLHMRRRINKFIPVLALLFGAYLISRGLMMSSMGH